MVSRKTFYLVVATYVGLRLAEGPVKMWIRRTIAEPGHGPASKLAEALVTDLGG